MSEQQTVLTLDMRLPKIGESWTQGDGVVCEVFNAWWASAQENGVVVRWPKHVKDRKAFYSVDVFLDLFVHHDPNVQQELFISDQLR